MNLIALLDMFYGLRTNHYFNRIMNGKNQNQSRNVISRTGEFLLRSPSVNIIFIRTIRD